MLLVPPLFLPFFLFISFFFFQIFLLSVSSSFFVLILLFSKVVRSQRAISPGFEPRHVNGIFFLLYPPCIPAVSDLCSSFFWRLHLTFLFICLALRPFCFLVVFSGSSFVVVFSLFFPLLSSSLSRFDVFFISSSFLQSSTYVLPHTLFFYFFSQKSALLLSECAGLSVAGLSSFTLLSYPFCGVFAFEQSFVCAWIA